ncbi:MAG: cobyric acid synthase [Desulfovibrionaceae bacterium]|jgi:adenosylcobyric acid synthase|nr:cobyric acid synthase [Desulfovibrionaceae bacterium]
MVQGTTSNAGKSVLVAALCRILLQDGLRVAPFKAQNMSLNSFVTPDGREIGRAQATQAAACRLEPDARMNPVLLKPTGDAGSQVIILGKPVADMRVAEYVRYKPTAFEAVKRAYDELAAEFDVVVIEGAGSPAEINLKAHDIVNMAMARHAKAPVLLAVDIDRGGAFAQLVGTWELLEGWERELLAGFVLNRFRGDASLLDSALVETTRRTGRPFFGVVPFIPDLGLPEEDSVSFKEAADRRAGAGRTDVGQPDAGRANADRDAAVDVVLVDLPRISNFTDFDALRAEPDVRLRVARRPGDLRGPGGALPDAVLLPGSKNTLADLATLRESGLAAALLELAALPDGPVVAGICGGFQMLGERIEDLEGVDGCVEGHKNGAAPGLGLLAVATVMGADKVLTRTTARHLETGLEVAGYEIHHGVTRSCGGAAGAATDRARPAFAAPDGGTLGYADATGRIWGCYLHGVFDAGPFRRWFVNSLRARRSLAPIAEPAPFGMEAALDRLADVVRAALDMRAVYALLGL